ncbi:MAG: hypothetical protein ACOYL6_11670 [Bacteriovoracaceae bacterium]
MVRTLSIFIFIFLFLFKSEAATRQTTLGLRYSLKDLEIVKDEKDYADFFLHAKDLRPSQRTDNWKSMIDEMGVSWAQKMKLSATFDSSHFQFMEEMFELAPLQTNERFKQLRAELGLKYFRQALSTLENEKINQLILMMKNFWKKDQDTHETGLTLLKLVYEQNNDISEAWYFVDSPLKSAQSAFYCSRKDIEPLVMTKLARAFEESLASPKKVILSVIHKECWNAIKTNAKSYYLSFPQRIRGSFYTLLSEEGLINSIEKDLYSFFYLMEGPIKGEAMNQTWNIVGALKNENKKREELIERLQSLDTLPDAVLGSYDQDRKQIIVNFVGKVFPEYFDFYARTCIQYLKGEVKFAEGNPTLHCKDLFKMVEKNPDLVNPVLTIQYKQSI